MLRNTPPVTRALILACLVAYAVELAFVDLAFGYLALWPPVSGLDVVAGGAFRPWQLVTYAFLHGSLLHLGFNMFALFMFGSDVERLFGPRRFLNLYLVSVITAALTQLVYAMSTAAEPYPTVGASGGVFGVLLAFGICFPNRTILLLIPPVPMPARMLVIVYGALELYLGVTGSQQGVAHFAHLGGMLGAWLLIRHWRTRPPTRGPW